MFCSKCGAQNADGAAFCKSCGTRLMQMERNETVNTVRGGGTVSTPLKSHLNFKNRVDKTEPSTQGESFVNTSPDEEEVSSNGTPSPSLIDKTAAFLIAIPVYHL